MPIVDTNALPEILMRKGVTGRWLSGSEHGASSVSVLRNWVEPGVTIPRHLHDQEEIVLVETGEVWVEIDGVRTTPSPARPSSSRHAPLMPGGPTRARRRSCSSGRSWIRSRRARALTWRASRQPWRE